MNFKSYTQNLLFVSPLATEEIIDLVTRRWDVLDSLSDQTLSKPELEESLGVSRSTVNRAISELEAASLVASDPPNGYELTELGWPVYQLYQRMQRSLDTVIKAYSLGLNIPQGTNGELPMYDGATVVHSEPHIPDKPLQRLLDKIRKVSLIQGYMPVVLQQYVEVCCGRAVHHGTEVDLIVTPEAHEWLRTTYVDEYRSTLEASRFCLHETTFSLPFGLLLFGKESDRTCALVSYSKAGMTGVLFNDTTSAVGWVTQMYRKIRTDSTPVDQLETTQ